MTSINGEAPFLDMSAETGPTNNHGQRSMEYRSLYDPVEAAQDSRAVNRFSKFMLAKMAQAGANGRSGWYDKERCTREYLSDLLREAVHKGDPVDIANYAMMLHDRGETVAPVGGEFDPDFLDPADQIEIIYTNYKGETAKRRITPRHLWRGATEWHPEPQWLLRAYDHDKGAERDFALKDFGRKEPSAARGLALEEAAQIAEDYVQYDVATAIRALSSPDHADAGKVEGDGDDAPCTCCNGTGWYWSMERYCDCDDGIAVSGCGSGSKAGLEEAVRFHEREAEYYEAREGDKDGIPFPIAAGWHRLNAHRIRALTPQPDTPEAGTPSNDPCVINDGDVAYLGIGEKKYAIPFIQRLLEKDEQRRDARLTAATKQASVLGSAFPNGLEVITYPVASFLHEPGKLDAPVAALSGRLHRSHAKAIAAAITGTDPKVTVEGEGVYDAGDDAKKCYDLAVEVKRKRGDTHWPERLQP